VGAVLGGAGRPWRALDEDRASIRTRRSSAYGSGISRPSRTAQIQSRPARIIWSKWSVGPGTTYSRSPGVTTRRRKSAG